jgi:hypothetical protein
MASADIIEYKPCSLCARCFVGAFLTSDDGKIIICEQAFAHHLCTECFLQCATYRAGTSETPLNLRTVTVVGMPPRESQHPIHLA